MEIAGITKQRIMGYIGKGLRFDGRKLLQYRDISIETGISNKAEGSARVKIGQTEVLAGIKIGLAEPFTDSPDEGALMVTAEFSPMASEKFEKGPPSIQAVELARIVDRGIRESGIIDLSKLCIEKGEKVWAVFVDIYPVNDAGNLIDAAALAALAALKMAVFPELIDKEKINYGVLTNKKLPLTENAPYTITFYKIGENFIIDPVVEEEEASEARLTMAVSSSKKGPLINAVQKGGNATLSSEEIAFILDAATKEYSKLEAKLEAALKKAEK